MEVTIFSDRALASMADWQRAIAAENYDLQFLFEPPSESERPLAAINGYRPALLAGRPSGFECYSDDPAELIETYDNIDFGRSWRCALSLRFGGDFDELRAAMMAATAYARATGGVVFEPEAGEIMQPDRAAAETRRIEADLARMAARPG